MNSTEIKMVEILRKGKEKFGYIGVKAEFEAEGTRVEELLRLLDITHRANLKIAVKIGGCEAKRDLMESKQFGVDYVIAPMVETDYSLSKYINAKNAIYTEEEQEHTDFLINLETNTAFENRKKIMELSAKNIDGIVFGRVDFSESLGIGRDGIHDDKVTESVCDVAQLCVNNKLDLVVGGAISNVSIGALKRIKNIHLNRFETRKIVFDSEAIDTKNIEDGLLSAVEFELLWLKNKKNHYSVIEKEDDQRIEMLNSRWNILNN